MVSGRPRGWATLCALDEAWFVLDLFVRIRISLPLACRLVYLAPLEDKRRCANSFRVFGSALFGDILASLRTRSLVIFFGSALFGDISSAPHKPVSPNTCFYLQEL